MGISKSTTLIIHGWSDCSNSFVALKQRLKENEAGTVDTILYADYESREDNVTFNDVVDGLNEQLVEKGLIHPDGSKKDYLNVIVHSTGGLVVRHWIWRYYSHRIEDCPIKRVVMLAPANFGSPLAHRGKSFLGRLVKGRWKIGDLLEVGRQLLDGLELASPYQWELAHNDIFGVDDSYYNRKQVQLTILTGIKDYEGARGWVNKPGTDGTIVIAGAPLNTVKLKLDFSDQEVPYKWEKIKTANDFCFGVLPDLDHGSIVGKFEESSAEITDLVIEALKIETADQFCDFKNKLKQHTDETYRTYQEKDSIKYSCYQQFIIHGTDDHGATVSDFTLEFEVYKIKKAGDTIVSSQSYFNKLEQALSDEFQKVLLSDIHTHSKDTSYRRLLVNMNRLNHLFDKAKEKLGDFVLAMKIFVPGIDKGIYYDLSSLQNIIIYRSDTDHKSSDLPSLFYPNTTTLLELKVDRKTRYVRISKDPK